MTVPQELGQGQRHRAFHRPLSSPGGLAPRPGVSSHPPLSAGWGLGSPGQTGLLMSRKDAGKIMLHCCCLDTPENNRRPTTCPTVLSRELGSTFWKLRVPEITPSSELLPNTVLPSPRGDLGAVCLPGRPEASPGSYLASRVAQRLQGWSQIQQEASQTARRPWLSRLLPPGTSF